MNKAENYRKNPIYNTDFSKPASMIVTELRNKLTDIRGQFFDLESGLPQFKHIIDSMDGFLTTGIANLYHAIQEIQEIEISRDDNKYGKSLKFRPRGIGLDSCPGCFVCGGESQMMNNISGFVDSKEDGEKIVFWFESGARLDCRKSEPDWIQVKIGACEKHLPNLEKLDKMTHIHNVIRESMIEEAMK